MSRTRQRTRNPAGRPTGATGPRAGIRGQFTAGARNEAVARRRGKTGNRRRARHAAAQSLRTGVDRPALFGRWTHEGGRVPRQLQAPFLDPDDIGDSGAAR